MHALRILCRESDKKISRRKRRAPFSIQIIFVARYYTIQIFFVISFKIFLTSDNQRTLIFWKISLILTGPYFSESNERKIWNSLNFFSFWLNWWIDWKTIFCHFVGNVLILPQKVQTKSSLLQEKLLDKTYNHDPSNFFFYPLFHCHQQ